MLTVAELSTLKGVSHAFFTRAGGVSEGIYASLNCGFGSDDAREAVALNRRIAMERLALAGEALVTGYQTHGIAVAQIDHASRNQEPPKVDGLVTRTPGIALGILTADCAAVLFADPNSGVIGAAHAGWRGALIGILDQTVAAMESLGAQRGRIRAAIGPCIGRESYEVGPEFPAPFLAEDMGNAAFFAPAARPGKFRFDLEAYVRARLVRLGLARPGTVGADTCAEEARFFSYRRSVLRGEKSYGRGLSAIALTV